MANDLVPQNRRDGVAKVSSGNLPAPISNGLLDLLTVFSAQHQEEADKKRVWRVYAEAIAGAHPAAAEHAIQWLKLHNPRNPWRPTPQDVYETCCAVQAEWRNRIHDYFLRSNRHWGVASDGRYVKHSFEWGPEPLTKGCYMPDALVKEFIRERLDRGSSAVAELIALGREKIACIPKDCFLSGQLEAALTEWDKRDKEAAEAAKFNAYLDTLDPDLRYYRRVVLNQANNHKLPEDALLDLARKAMDKDAQEKAARKREEDAARIRSAVHMHPEVSQALERLQATARTGDRAAAVREYIRLLASHGARPPSNIVVEAAQYNIPVEDQP